MQMRLSSFCGVALSAVFLSYAELIEITAQTLQPGILNRTGSFVKQMVAQAGVFLREQYEEVHIDRELEQDIPSCITPLVRKALP